MKKQNSLFRFMNPRNLQREVHVYGYHFSWKNHLFILLSVLLGMSVLGLIFQLKPMFTILILILSFLFLPFLILDMYRKMYEQKRFADAVTYMEQLLYSFQKNRKVLAALYECMESFQEGEMRSAIQAGILHLERGKSETSNGILWEGLKKIEQMYPCKKINTVHMLLRNAEEDGGEVENSITLVLEDIENWKRRVYRLQAEKKQNHTDNTLSLVAATFICALSLYVIDYMRIMFGAVSMEGIQKSQAVQWTSLFFIIFAMFIFAKSSKSLTDDWLKEELIYDNERVRKDYKEVVEYDEIKEKRKSLVWSIPVLGISAYTYFTGPKWISALLLAAGTFLMIQHRVGHRLVKQDITNAMYLAFPQWLMEMALLLQNNNVQVSIVKSAEHAPTVLEQELKNLITRMEKEPDKLATYVSFCDRFQLPEIRSSMQMLHSISESGVGNANTQIHNLLQHINKMQDQADQLMDENVAFRMRMIFTYPVIATAIKMMIDMTVGMIFMFQMMGNIGGM